MQISVLFKAAVGAIDYANHNLRISALERISSFFSLETRQVGAPLTLVPKQLHFSLPLPSGNMQLDKAPTPLELRVPSLNLQSPAQLGIESGCATFECAINSIANSGADVYFNGEPIASKERRRPTRSACLLVSIHIKSVVPTAGEERLAAFLCKSVSSI
jgi:hypothetical protein